MKILVICNSASGLYDFRGMLLNNLLLLGHTVQAIVPVVDLPVEKDAKEKLKINGIDLMCLPMERRGMNPLKDFTLLRNYIDTIRKEKPDLVITYTIKPNAYGGIACRLCRVPYAVNITGLGTAFQGNGLLRKFVTTLYKIAFKKAKIVFFENEENRNIIVDSGVVENSKTHVLNGAGVDLEKFPYIAYPTDNEETRFLFIGRVMKEKGIDELFSAMKILQKNGRNCSLDILGGFDEDYSEIINKYKAEGWLRYHGYQNDVRPFIANCHCFVLPSWHEGMANTNLECAASGRPVITSNIHGCLEAVEDSVSGFLCEKQDINSLHNSMKKIVELDYDERKAMGVAGRRRMEEMFDKRVVVKATIKELMR